MRRLVAVAMLLAGCTSSITFRKVDMMAMVDDERNRYNLQAGLVNRACLAHALPPLECLDAAKDGTEAVAQYTDIRGKLLAKDTVTADMIIGWLLKIGSAVAHLYGIPMPSPPGVASPSLAGPAPTMPLMP